MCWLDSHTLVTEVDETISPSMTPNAVTSGGGALTAARFPFAVLDCDDSGRVATLWALGCT